MSHKSGFVNIIGRPNVGKSTLLNHLIGQKMAIVTHKPQTTRHRILCIINEPDYQVIFSDSPGVIEEPGYELHHALNKSAFSSFEDADILLFLTDHRDPFVVNEKLIHYIKDTKIPVFLVINKIDSMTQEKVDEITNWWNEKVGFSEIFIISAKNGINTDNLKKAIVSHLPKGPAYYPKDQFTDRPNRFWVTEIIREEILLQFRQEIPYAVEVVIEMYQEEETIDRISALIFVSRPTQKSIIIGKGGKSIKNLGIEARKKIEAFLGKKVYLELHVKVKKDWRDDENMLRRFGY